MENITFTGEWFFPYDRNNRLMGVLQVDSLGYRLELKGDFLKKTTKVYISLKSCFSESLDGVILGETINGELITMVGLSKFPNNLGNEVYYCENIFLGKHYESEKDIAFDKIEFSFHGLNGWLGEGLGFKSSDSEDNLKLDIDKNSMKVVLGSVDDISFTAKSETDCNFKSFYLTKRGIPLQGQKEISLKIKTKIVMERKDKKISFQEAKTTLFQIQRLFSLIFGKEMKFSEISFYENELLQFPGEKPKMFLEKRKFLSNEKSKLFGLEENGDDAKTDILFGLDDVETDFDKILNYWFQNSKKYNTIYNLYFVTKTNPGLHLENMFLNIIQAIEGLYTLSGMDTKEYITKDKKTELEDKLKQCSSISSSERKKYLIIKEDLSLVEKLEKLEKYMGISFQVDGVDVKERIARIRNTFSHGGRLPDYNIKYGDILTSENLYSIYQCMVMILEVSIIKELGIGEKLYEDIARTRKESFDKGLF